VGPQTPREPRTTKELPRPVPAVEPAAESTRALLASAPADEADVAAPDAEERRLSHDLDFGGPERQRRTSNDSGSTRRVAVILIVVVLLVCVAAVVFRTQIIAAAPALKPAYGALGL
jgi:hypothetical protein